MLRAWNFMRHRSGTPSPPIFSCCRHETISCHVSCSEHEFSCGMEVGLFVFSCFKHENFHALSMNFYFFMRHGSGTFFFMLSVSCFEHEIFMLKAWTRFMLKAQLGFSALGMNLFFMLWAWNFSCLEHGSGTPAFMLQAWKSRSCWKYDKKHHVLLIRNLWPCYTFIWCSSCIVAYIYDHECKY